MTPCRSGAPMSCSATASAMRPSRDRQETAERWRGEPAPPPCRPSKPEKTRLDHERRSNMTRQGCRYAAIALAALAVGCVPGSVAAPDDASGVTLSVVTGSAQSGRAGEELPWPLVVLATSAAGRPLAG